MKPDSVQTLRGSTEDSSMNDDHFKATLDALLEGDSDGSDPLHGGSSNTPQKASAKQVRARTSPETQAVAPKQNDSSSTNQFANASSLPSMLPEFVYNYLNGNSAHLGNQQGGEIARRMGFTQGTPFALDYNSGASNSSRKRTRATKVPSKTSLDKVSSAAISEDEGDRKKRRIDRNMREKERSKQITSQISALHEILEEANIDHKSDKFSTLVSVERYINQLHERTACLDAEHKSLLETLVSTSQAMQGGYIPAASNGMETQMLEPYVFSDVQPDSYTNAFVARTEFESVFDQCSFACSVANIDGRFLKVNSQFEKYTGFSSRELLDPLPGSGQHQSVEQRNMSIFNIVRREDMENMFEAMSEMLRRPMKLSSEPFCENEDRWTDIVEFSGHEGRAVST